MLNFEKMFNKKISFLRLLCVSSLKLKIQNLKLKDNFIFKKKSN